MLLQQWVIGIPSKKCKIQNIYWNFFYGQRSFFMASAAFFYGQRSVLKNAFFYGQRS